MISYAYYFYFSLFIILYMSRVLYDLLLFLAVDPAMKLCKMDNMLMHNPLLFRPNHKFYKDNSRLHLSH